MRGGAESYLRQPRYLKTAGRVDRAARRSGMRYAIVGGIAVNWYSNPPPTADIDIAVEPDEKKLGAFLAELRSEGVVETGRTMMLQDIADIVLRDPRTRLTVELLSGWAPTHLSAISSAVRVRVGRYSFRVASVEDVITTKAMAYFDRWKRKDIAAVQELLLKYEGRLNYQKMSEVMRNEGRHGQFRLILAASRRGKEGRH